MFPIAFSSLLGIMVLDYNLEGETVQIGIGSSYQNYYQNTAFKPVNSHGQADEVEDGFFYPIESEQFNRVDQHESNDKQKPCQTCANRKYQDGSDDPSVSFKSPTNISPEAAANAVRSHENEHVVNEQAKAKNEGGKVISQSVAIFTSVCPECKKVYVSGGETRTVTRYGSDGKPKDDNNSELGKKLDAVA